MMISAAAFVLAACSNEPAIEAADEATDPTENQNTTEAPQKEWTYQELRDAMINLAERNLVNSNAFLSENGKKEGVQTTESGLQYLILEEGPEDGFSPVSTDRVVVHYVGKLINGEEFDSSYARGASATFMANQVIPGWTEGVQLMKEGDKYRFFVPPELAYGAGGTANGPIGPNEALIFDVELIKVQNAERNLELAVAFLEENAKKQGVQTTQSGLQYEVLSENKDSDQTPVAESVVKVHYVGTLTNGTEFDSSYAREQPATFPLNRVIPGWTEGLQLMSPGEKFRFAIPPALGYGPGGTPDGSIGPNEALIFEVELLEIVEPETPASETTAAGAGDAE